MVLNGQPYGFWQFYTIYTTFSKTVSYRGSKIDRLLYGKLLESHGSSDKYPKSLIDCSHHFTLIDLEPIPDKTNVTDQ